MVYRRLRGPWTWGTGFWRVSSHFFVDETKENSYLLVASVHASGDLDDLRKLMRGLVLRGQTRVHMKKESEPRKREIAAAICGAGVTATIYDAGRRYRKELDARAACLRGLVGDTANHAEAMLVFEQDDSLVNWDRRRLYEIAREARRPLLRYEHRRANAEQLLAIPDAIAWCWAKGGDWRRRVQPAVAAVRSV